MVQIIECFIQLCQSVQVIEWNVEMFLDDKILPGNLHQFVA